MALRVQTANVTGWSSAQAWLTRTDAHVVLLHEHHLVKGDKLCEASQWCTRNGWHPIFEPAAPGVGLGSSGGVAILARKFLGLHYPAAGSCIVPHRAVASIIYLPGTSLYIHEVSAYLHDDQGLSEANINILNSIGSHLVATGYPHIVGADWNVEPDDLVTTGILRRTSSCLRVPEGGGTCLVANSTVRRLIDYFMIHMSLTHAIDHIWKPSAADLKTHEPVQLQFKERTCQLLVDAIRIPRKFPTKRLHGPIRPPPCYTSSLHRVNSGIHDAFRQDLDAARVSLR